MVCPDIKHIKVIYTYRWTVIQTDKQTYLQAGAALGYLLRGGGGGVEMAKCLTEHCPSPEKGAQWVGGGGLRHIFFIFRTEKFCGKIIITIMG